MEKPSLNMVVGQGRWKSMAAGVAGCVLCLLPLSITGQTPAPPDPFAPIAFMLGRWEGTSEGQPGKGTVHREYSRTLNSRFIRAHNRSEYSPQDKNPKGEVHEHEDWFSFDRARKRIVLRQPSRPKKNLHPNLGPIWVQNRPNIG